MEKIIKISLAILLLVCLAKMPYGYFQLVRFLALVGFGLLAYQSSKRNSETEVILYIILAILFQPFFKISLGRMFWNIVDVIAAIGLLLSVLKSKK